ncbi:MAG: hypothetical protein ACRDNF_25420 [Streptosporangiaceae bacterium]
MRPVVVFTPPQFREYRRRQRDRRLTICLLAALVIALAAALSAHSTARARHREPASPPWASAAPTSPLHADPTAPSPTARPHPSPGRAARSTTCDSTTAHHLARRNQP